MYPSMGRTPLAVSVLISPSHARFKRPLPSASLYDFVWPHLFLLCFSLYRCMFSVLSVFICVLTQ